MRAQLKKEIKERKEKEGRNKEREEGWKEGRKKEKNPNMWDSLMATLKHLLDRR